MNLAVPELAGVSVVILLTFDTQGMSMPQSRATRRRRGIGRTGRSTTAVPPSAKTPCGVAGSACCEPSEGLAHQDYGPAFPRT